MTEIQKPPETHCKIPACRSQAVCELPLFTANTAARGTRWEHEGERRVSHHAGQVAAVTQATRSAQRTSAISMLAPSMVPMMRQPFMANFMLLVPLASVPAVLMCWLSSAPGISTSARSTL